MFILMWQDGRLRDHDSALVHVDERLMVRPTKPALDEEFSSISCRFIELDETFENRCSTAVTAGISGCMDFLRGYNEQLSRVLKDTETRLKATEEHLKFCKCNQAPEGKPELDKPKVVPAKPKVVCPNCVRQQYK